MKLVADAMKDEDDGWVHHLRSENIAMSVTEGGAYVEQWINGRGIRALRGLGLWRCFQHLHSLPGFRHSAVKIK